MGDGVLLGSGGVAGLVYKESVTMVLVQAMVCYAVAVEWQG